MTELCAISHKYMNRCDMIKISNYYVDPATFKDYIKSLQLGIPLELASEEEWVLTASNDKWDSSIIRLRNPFTNLPFSTEELVYIYNNLH